MKHRRRFAISISIVGAAFLLLVLVHYNTSFVKAASVGQDGLLSDDLFLMQATGYITMLRAHDLGTGYGPGDDFIDGEVVIHLSSRESEGFGFQLRNDEYLPARQGMLNLLRDAFNNDWIVTINYWIEADKSNGEIIRVWLTKPVEEDEI